MSMTDLIANPLAAICIYLPSRYHCCSHNGDQGTTNQNWRVVANTIRENPAPNHKQNITQQQCNQRETRRLWCFSLNSLEPNGKVVCEHDQQGAYPKVCDASSRDCTLEEDLAWDSGVFLSPDLDAYEGEAEDAEENEERNDDAAVPRILYVTPL